MINFKYLFILFLLTTTLNAGINNEYYFGVSISKYNKSYQNRIKHLILKLAKDIQKSFDEKINIVFLDSDKKILEDLKSYKKMNVLVIHSSFYLKNKKILKKILKRPFLFNNISNKKNQYYLIANKESNIKKLADLKNKVYGYYKGDNSYNIWADYTLRKDLKVSLNELTKTKIVVEKSQKLMLDVFFQKSDFSVVTKVLYDDMVLLNPAIKKKILILKKSKPIFFLAIGLFHKDMSKKLVEQYYKLIDNGEFNRKFSNLYKLLNLYGIQKTSFDDLKELDIYYDEYKKLKKSM
jgi:hypothetical protein